MFKAFGTKISNGFPSNTFSVGQKILAPNPYVWLDANNPLNTSARWYDKSENDWLCTQSTAINQPSLVASAINNQSAYRFDGNDFLKLNFGSNLAQPIIVFCVWNIKVDTLVSVAYDNYSTSLFNLRNYSNNIYASSSNNNLTYPKTKPFSTILNTVVYNSPNSFIYENGILKSIADSGNGTMNGLTIGAWYDGSSYFLNGEVAEIIVYNRLLNEMERVSTENYLKLKYAIY